MERDVGEVGMVTVFHGSDRELSVLKPGSFITRSLKDAWKFGYRRAVENSSEFVFVYRTDIDPNILRGDPNRDRAFVLAKEAKALLVARSGKWDSPFKLKSFHFKQ